MNPQQFAQAVQPPQTAPEVQALADALRIIDVPSKNAMPPIRFEFPEPLRVAESLYGKGIRATDPNALDPAGRITEILAAFSHESFEDAREVLALILRGHTGTDAVKQVKPNASLAHQEPAPEPAADGAQDDPDPGRSPMPDPR
ncbi:hypothetical protein [Nocardia brasiliensis]|uniref:hypothetical protein n=1 Tax=Nocardia brasiliensis TaxID=37326 RepID=UPI002457C802|nr:hypothetical protein [Nocardia brasiliensis]